jgi:hypothetical protein
VVDGDFAPGNPATLWNPKHPLAALDSNRIGPVLHWSRSAPLFCWPELSSDLKLTPFILSAFARYSWPLAELTFRQTCFAPIGGASMKKLKK